MIDQIGMSVKAVIMSLLGSVKKDLLTTTEGVEKTSYLFCGPEATYCVWQVEKSS